MIIAIALISIFLVVTVPRVSRAVRSEAANRKVLLSVFSVTRNEAMRAGQPRFLLVHLNRDDGSADDFSSRSNGISVMGFGPEGTLTELPGEMFRFRQFNNFFTLTEVVTSRGVRVSAGEIMIPLYPDGTSESVLLNFDGSGGITSFRIDGASGTLTELDEVRQNAYVTK
jgi:hypothetical protein